MAGDRTMGDVPAPDEARVTIEAMLEALGAVGDAMRTLRLPSTETSTDEGGAGSGVYALALAARQRVNDLQLVSQAIDDMYALVASRESGYADVIAEARAILEEAEGIDDLMAVDWADLRDRRDACAPGNELEELLGQGVGMTEEAVEVSAFDWDQDGPTR